MDRQEVVQKLAKVARISVAYAEDLYDSLLPIPIVPECVADWYEEHKNNFESDIYYLIRFWEEEERTSDFYKWFDNPKNEAIKTLVNMHQFGYTVESEPKYMVRIKGVSEINRYLNKEFDKEFLFADSGESEDYRTKFTRKELEANGFGWVFNCEGVEVKEVTDEQPNQ